MQHSSIRVVRPEQFDSATAQTPGSKRAAAIYPAAGIDSPMWGGLFVVEPGAHTGIHHHGEQHTIAYILSGTSYIRWGDRGEFNATARAGDFPIRPSLASAPGNKSFARRPFPVGCGPQHSRTNCREPSERRLG